MPKLICARCQYSWFPRTDEKPKQCPRCRSPHWEEARAKVPVVEMAK